MQKKVAKSKKKQRKIGKDYRNKVKINRLKKEHRNRLKKVRQT